MIRTNGKRGFTLIELLVVVAMIAMIMGSISISMSSAMQRARIEKATSEVKIISQAILAYENHDREHEIPEMKRREANSSTLNFLLGDAGNANSGEKIPVLMQAAMRGGTIRDPWGHPYLITIYAKNIDAKSITPETVQTGYWLQNFNRLTEDEHK